MQKYGLMVDGQLLLSSEQLERYKPVVYAVVPDFDQATQYISHGDITEYDDRIEVSLEVLNLNQEDTVEVETPVSDFVESPPWKQVPKQADEEKRLTLLEDAVLLLLME
jgi:hypothetical protein